MSTKKGYSIRIEGVGKVNKAGDSADIQKLLLDFQATLATNGHLVHQCRLWADQFPEINLLEPYHKDVAKGKFP